MAGITKIPTIWSNASGGPGRLLRKGPRLSKDRTGPITRNASSLAKRRRKTWISVRHRRRPRLQGTQQQVRYLRKLIRPLMQHPSSPPARMLPRQPMTLPPGGRPSAPHRNHPRLPKTVHPHRMKVRTWKMEPLHEARHSIRGASIHKATGIRGSAAIRG